MKEGRDGLWSAEDEHGTELEVSEFLYALVRMLKPRIIVETGCYNGQTTKLLLKARNENQYGEVWACDTDKEKVEKAVTGTFPDVTILHCEGLELIKQVGMVDLIFIDGGTNEEREKQFVFASNRLTPNGIIALHDTAQPRYPKLIKNGLREFKFDTPRGITIYQKI